MADGCWDLEDTEGFEEYHDELKAFAQEHDAKMKAKAETREREHLHKLGQQWGLPWEDHEPLLRLLNAMERRISELEATVHETL